MTRILNNMPAHLAEDLLGAGVLMILLLASLHLPGVF